ncbi:MAG: hypothetical protein LUG51_15850 [Tannerellaceae bacterium]|nr:hypothetical protein [Tannerellaceae bacterium]
MLDDLNYPFLTATKYVDNLGNREIFSNTDSVFYIKADTVSPFTAGIRKEITFKGYMKIPRWFIFKQMSVSFTVLGLIWLICMGIFAFLLFRKNPVVEKKKREGLIPITDDISFDKERKCLVGPNKRLR